MSSSLHISQQSLCLCWTLGNATVVEGILYFRNYMDTISHMHKAWSRSCLFINTGKTNFFLIKPTDTLISQIYFRQETTCFGQFLCPSSGVFHCTFDTGLCHTGLMTALKHDQDGHAWKLSIKPAWHIPVLNVQWKTPDDGQRNCLKHVVSWQKQIWEIGVSVGFIKKKFVTMHGHINIKLVKLTLAKCLELMLLPFEESTKYTVHQIRPPHLPPTPKNVKCISVQLLTVQSQTHMSISWVWWCVAAMCGARSIIKLCTYSLHTAYTTIICMTCYNHTGL